MHSPVITWMVLIAGLVAGAWLGNAMKKAAHPNVKQGRFEFAWSARNANTLLVNWGEGARERLTKVITLDFAFIPAYVAALGAALCLVAPHAGSASATSFGMALVVGVCVAGLLDAVENGAMLLFLAGRGGGWMPVAFVTAAIKWTLVVIACSYLVWTLAGMAYQRLWLR